MMFTGSMVALVTPMFEDGTIDYKSIDKLIEWHIAEGTQALIIAGTTGESATLTKQEKKHLFKHAIERAAGRITIIAGTNAQSTDISCQLTSMALEAGVDAALIMTPAYIKPTQQGLIKHYQTIATEVPLPIILYNVPGRTACDMKPETVATLANISNIVAIKEATGSLERLRELIQLCGDKINFLSGDDATAADFMLQGGHGTISVTANVVPGLMAKLAKLCLADEQEAAHQLDAKLQGLHHDLFSEANPIPCKWLLAKMGFISDSLRLPLTPLSEAFHNKLFESYRTSQV